MIPKEASYLRECIYSFKSLNLKQVIDLSKVDSPDYLNAMPIFGNFIFHMKMRKPNRKYWKEMNIYTLGGLINKTTNKPLTKSDFIQISKAHFPLKPPSFHRARGKEGMRILAQVPLDAIRALTLPHKPYKTGEMVYFESDNEGPVYGIIDLAKNQIQQLRTDHSGFYVEAGTPYDTSQWDAQDWEDTIDPITNNVIWTGVRRASMWGKPAKRRFSTYNFNNMTYDDSEIENKVLIRGISSNTYPQLEGWTIKGSKETMSLNQMSISRITKALTLPKTKRPSTEDLNNKKYGEALPTTV